jgi:hypothetical protein
MLARRAIEAKPRVRNIRTARMAAVQRRTRAAQVRSADLWRFFGLFTVVLALLMGYVMLISDLTGLNYAVARAERERVALEDQTARLDDRIAALRSQDRLAAIAAEFGMRDAQQFAIVTVPSEQKRAAPRPRLALLSTFGWLRTTH